MKRRSRESAVVLLSGGLDSAVALAWTLARGYEAHALSFRYGQVHARELKSAARISRHLGVSSHRVLDVGLGALGASALTAWPGKIPLGRSRNAIRHSVELGQAPATYVPARNSVFLSLGAAAAEALGAGTVVIGANALDYSGYVDCRPAFLSAMEKALRLGTVRGVRTGQFKILAPLLYLSKKQIIKEGIRRGVNFGLTWSCYRGGTRPCGACESCVLRSQGFAEAGCPDPLVP